MKFNANACISPTGNVTLIKYGGHSATLAMLTFAPSLRQLIETDEPYDEEMHHAALRSPRWLDNLVKEGKWILVSGWHGNYTVTASNTPSKGSLEGLYDLATWAKCSGDNVTFEQLHEAYKKLAGQTVFENI